MNNQMGEIYDSKSHQINDFYGSIKNDTKFCKRLSNEDQQKQNQRVSLMEKFNYNCVSKSFDLQSISEDLAQLNDFNDECLISIFKCLPNDDRERVIEVCERWRRLGVESSGLSKKLKNENNENNMIRNFQNSEFPSPRIFSQEANCTIEINHDLHQVGNIISPTVYFCPVYTICAFFVIIAIVIIYLFYIVIIVTRREKTYLSVQKSIFGL